MHAPISGKTDILVVGGGPAGCMAASTLARYGIDFRLVDKRPSKTLAGHASAFQPRTQEILQTLGLLHTLDMQGHRLTETAFWTGDDQGKLFRTNIGREVVHPTPYPYLFNADQGIVETTFEKDLLAKGHIIHRNLELVDCVYRETEDSDYPMVAYLQNHVSGAIEAWEVKYVLGADGAQGATRNIAGIPIQSQGGEHVWAVADIFLETNFPDFRRRAVFRTPNGGCMFIPRKDDGLRIFVQLDHADDESPNKYGAQEKTKRSLQDTASFKLLSMIQSQVQKTLSPFEFNITKVLWVSRYRVTQRLVDHFHDDRQHILLMGDACHTHSPKAGQGMNVSISDAYNLTWKLAMVHKGLAKPELLTSYEFERKYIAEQLVEFDAKFAKSFAQTDKLHDSTPHDLWKENQGFTSGCEYRYPEGLLVSNEVRTIIDNHARSPPTPGKRLLSIPLIRNVDGNAVNLLDEMPTSARFHLFIYAGSNIKQNSLLKLAEFLSQPESPCYRFNQSAPNNLQPFRQQDIYSTYPEFNSKYAVDLFLIHSVPRHKFEVEGIPALLKDIWTSRIYEDVDGAGHADHGVLEEVGALVLVRPDGYISLVTALDRPEDIVEFLQRFMIEGEWFSQQDHFLS